MKIKRDYDLTPHSYYRTQAKCAKFIVIESRDDLLELDERDFFILGNGSNLLFSKENYSETFISLKGLSGIEKTDKGVEVLAGTLISTLLKFCADNDLGGLEFLTSIPATVGGALFMNAGAYGDEILNHVKKVTLFNLATKTFREVGIQKEDYGYRAQNITKENEILVSALITLDKDPFDHNLASDIKKVRLTKFPKNPNSGSVFKNPEGMKAWELIEKAGLKGHEIGGARVSLEHANIIENLGGATGSEIFALITHIQQEVKKSAGIELVIEVRVL